MDISWANFAAFSAAPPAHFCARRIRGAETPVTHQGFPPRNGSRGKPREDTCNAGYSHGKLSAAAAVSLPPNLWSASRPGNAGLPPVIQNAPRTADTEEAHVSALARNQCAQRGLAGRHTTFKNNSTSPSTISSPRARIRPSRHATFLVERTQ